jgi:hypothetical protein
MLRWLVSIVFACAFLLSGAVIAMEAMGLIFLAAADDPEQRIEAVVAQIEASVDPRDVPSEAEAEGLWPPPETHAKEQATGEPAKAEQAYGDKAALIPVDLTEAGPASATAVGGVGTARVAAETESETEADALDPTPPAPKLVAVGKTADPIVSTPKLGPVPDAKPTKAPAPRRAELPPASCLVNCPISVAVTLP